MRFLFEDIIGLGICIGGYAEKLRNEKISSLLTEEQTAARSAQA
mgnify:CR=1 FL=1